MRWHRRLARRDRSVFPFAARRHRLELVKDDTLSPAPGLSVAYLCRTAGCTRGTCARCTELREWGARSACSCGAPLEQPPHVFVDRRPLCGECASR
jgi:hypothetical protein